MTVIDMDNKERRFIVGLSSGLHPVHIELTTARSRHGIPAEMEYKTVVVGAKVK